MWLLHQKVDLALTMAMDTFTENPDSSSLYQKLCTSGKTRQTQGKTKATELFILSVNYYAYERPGTGTQADA